MKTNKINWVRWTGPFFWLLINKKKNNFTSILTPLTKMSRFLSVFLKDDLQMKNYRSEQNQIIRSQLKDGTFHLKNVLFENSEVEKSLLSRERKLKKCKSVSKHLNSRSDFLVMRDQMLFNCNLRPLIIYEWTFTKLSIDYLNIWRVCVFFFNFNRISNTVLQYLFFAKIFGITKRNLSS